MHRRPLTKVLHIVPAQRNVHLYMEQHYYLNSSFFPGALVTSNLEKEDQPLQHSDQDHHYKIKMKVLSKSASFEAEITRVLIKRIKLERF